MNAIKAIKRYFRKCNGNFKLLSDDTKGGNKNCMRVSLKLRHVKKNLFHAQSCNKLYDNFIHKNPKISYFNHNFYCWNFLFADRRKYLNQNCPLSKSKKHLMSYIKKFCHSPDKFLDFCSHKEFRFRFLLLVYFQHDIINDVVQKYSQKKRRRWKKKEKNY